MSTPRSVKIALLVSWTLNVAVIVAFLLRHHDYMRHPGPPEDIRRFVPREQREEMRRMMEPLIHRQFKLSDELYDEMTAASLDTTIVSRVSDSLGEVRIEMQRLVIKHMVDLHDKLPPEAREMIVKRSIGRMLGGPHFRGEPGLPGPPDLPPPDER